LAAAGSSSAWLGSGRPQVHVGLIAATGRDLRLIGERAAGARIDAGGGRGCNRGRAQEMSLLLDIDRLALGCRGFAGSICDILVGLEVGFGLLIRPACAA